MDLVDLKKYSFNVGCQVLKRRTLYYRNCYRWQQITFDFLFMFISFIIQIISFIRADVPDSNSGKNLNALSKLSWCETWSNDKQFIRRFI